MAEVEKIAAGNGGRYRLRSHDQLMTVSAQDLRDIYADTISNYGRKPRWSSSYASRTRQNARRAMSRLEQEAKQDQAAQAFVAQFFQLHGKK